MKASPRGLNCSAYWGSKWPSSTPATMATTTWKSVDGRKGSRSGMADLRGDGVHVRLRQDSWGCAPPGPQGTTAGPIRVRPHAQFPSPLLTPLLPYLSLLFGGMLALHAAAGDLAWHHALRGEAESVQRMLTLYARPLGQRDRPLRTLPRWLAWTSNCVPPSPPLSPPSRRLNRKAGRGHVVQPVPPSADAVDRHRHGPGRQQHWREGAQQRWAVDYSFGLRGSRPGARQRTLYGIRPATGVPGYFLSQAILDAQGAVAGLVVIKDRGAGAGRAMLQTRRGFWHWTTMAWSSWPASRTGATSADDPVPRPTSAALAATRSTRPGTAPLAHPDPRKLEPRQPAGTAAGAVCRDTLWQTCTCRAATGRLHLLHDTHASTVASRWAAAAAAGGWLALCCWYVFIRQRAVAALACAVAGSWR
ncbi:hypothetical protein FQR65_LT20451 [Abscondita terminalis]|nr:hypothetical protein FQR65_LT20451 [Abscondita terminalis]